MIHQPVLSLTAPIVYAIDALHGKRCTHLVSSDEGLLRVFVTASYCAKLKESDVFGVLRVIFLALFVMSLRLGGVGLGGF